MIDEVLQDVKPGIIYEVLISTISPSGETDIAPMGLRFSSGLRTFRISPFKDAKTLRNLRAVGEGVVNITRDPRPFILGSIPELKNELFRELENSRHVKAPRLRNSEAYIEFKVKRFEERGVNRVDVICEPLSTYLGRMRVVPYSRAAFALVEAAVEASRVRIFLNRSKNLLKLLQRIEEMRDIVEKTARQSDYEELMKKLIQIINEILRGRRGP